VFGVKSSLLIDLGEADATVAKQYGVSKGSKTITYDFVLVSKQEAVDLRAKNGKEALEKLGRKVQIVDGLPVPDLD
jgi:hypothetical protein